MTKISKEEKGGVKQKLRAFKKVGLESYAKYLDKELKASEGKEIRKAYTKYIEKEVDSTAKKLARLNEKLSR
ncbi:MAG: hypothetical protein ACI85F_000833 [Bacteroidia bacterium]|jgi:hypothetical protein